MVVVDGRGLAWLSCEIRRVYRVRLTRLRQVVAMPSQLVYQKWSSLQGWPLSAVDTDRDTALESSLFAETAKAQR
jgi:hypothetical protein